jgi:hypothetical protein
LHLNGEINTVVASVADAQRCQHVAFGGDADAGTPPFFGFYADLFPQATFYALDFRVFGVGLYLC